MVEDHFGLLTACLRRHDGLLVKTIGDAVMASFTRVGRGLLAALEAIRDCTAYSRDPARCPKGGSVQLKVGVHAGPCMLVTLNNVMDYFGQTVNIAARIQGKAASNEIIVSDAIWKDEVVARVIPQLQVLRIRA